MQLIVSHPTGKDTFRVLVNLVAQLGKVSNISFAPKPSEDYQLSVEGTVLKGFLQVIRYLARLSPSQGLYGKSANEHTNARLSTQVDEWLDFVQKKVENVSKEELVNVVQLLENHFQLRSFLVDYRVTIADLYLWFSLKGNSNSESVLEASKKNNVNFGRWLDHLEQLGKLNTATSGTTANRAGSQGSFSKLELPNAKDGEMCTRFPPEPSGYLHIGHAKAALMNNHYAQYYHGKLIIRFDDTNPSKEKEEYVDSILEDLKTLGIQSSVPITHTSDYFQDCQNLMEQFLKEGKGYVDDTDVETMRKERGEGIPSKCRDQSVEENLRRWNEMKNGTPEGIKCVVRAKIDMQQKNKVLRDPSLYRCVVGQSHHRTGTKYKVYPLYDFACPIVDSLEGVTHALRSSEYHDRNALYYWVLDALRLRRPFIQDFSRLNFSYMLLSKRKLQKLVDIGVVSGWDDPRFPTIRGLLRRGLTVEALKEFILSQGASKSLNLMDVEKLWALNKKIIDPIIPRYTAVVKEGKVLLTLKDGPSPVEYKSVPKHKKNESLGKKVVAYSNKIWLEGLDAVSIEDGEEITLMDWGNIVVDKVHKDQSGVVTGLEGHLNLAGDIKLTKKKLTWLADSSDLLNVTLVSYDHLLREKKLPDDVSDWETFINRDSKHDVPAVGDSSLRSLQKGDRIQLERRGYFIVDQAVTASSNDLVLVEIPDGHTSKEQSVLTTKAPAADKKQAEKAKA
eukprot:TRINITY_DN1249_c0_g1_i1.p1 TRINITY_DN1249_c0_g1~~TRINITY_DN1249_c0_g1_i1.p1  ORF type:complete len:732 (-),score=316.99 TRINITY_DN1249_c0_g1_i1:66-2261(-)